MRLYTTKVEIVAAVQWQPGVKYPGLAEHISFEGDIFGVLEMKDFNGRAQLQIFPGEWIVKRDDGFEFSMRDADFRNKYNSVQGVTTEEASLWVLKEQLNAANT